jgi:membrane protein implicated in regulation of membrane protease activity
VDWNWVLLIGGACLVLLELALGGFAGFDMVLIGSAFMIGGGIGLWLHNTNLAIIAAGVLCLAYLGVGRRWVRRRMTAKHIPSNADAVLGQSGIVIARIAEHEPGRVKVRGEEWLASPVPGLSGPLESGTVVVVEAVDGVTLIVR